MKIKKYYTIDYVDFEGIAKNVYSAPASLFTETLERYNALADFHFSVNPDAYITLNVYAYLIDNDGEAVEGSDVKIVQLLPELKV